MGFAKIHESAVAAGVIDDDTRQTHLEASRFTTVTWTDE